MPMTMSDFEGCFRKLELAYRTKVAPEMVASYYSELQHHEASDLRSACQKLPAYERTFPTASTLTAYLLDAQHARRTREQRDTPRDIGEVARRCQRGQQDDDFGSLCAAMIQVGQSEQRQELVASFIDTHGEWVRDHPDAREWLREKLC